MGMTQGANDQILLALEFFDRAQQFRTQYERSPNLGRPPEWPKYSLFYHAIELALKAYLLQQGITVEALIDTFGHDTKSLVNEAVRLGLSLPRGTPEMIAGLSEHPPVESPRRRTHIKIRYPPESPVFSLGQFEPHMHLLFDAVRMALGLS
jgi:hypothetical protein